MTITLDERANPGTLTKLATAPLDVKDRCDQCGAQSWMRATKGMSELIFCGHDGAKHLHALVAQGFTVDDQRQRLHHVVSEAKSNAFAK